MIYYDRKTKITTNIKDSSALIFLYKTVIGRIILKIISSKLFSKIFGKIMYLRISKLYINPFIKKNNIDLSKYKKEKYKNFNDFFIRNIKDQKKMIKNEMLISPCDSKLQVYKINDKLTFNVKNSTYNVENLIKEKISKDYNGGYCLIFRLSPEDYHHYHAFDDTKIILNKKINGKLHTVNPVSYDQYKVFTENQREVSLLETKNFDEVYQIEVGALNIGKIHNKNTKELKRFEEKGYFSFGGSTIILLFKKDIIEIDKDILEYSNMSIETKISYKEIIGKKKS